MSRVDIPEEKRRDFYLYIDEFQNFSTDSFANILSEARKYRLDLIMAHQYIEQLDEKVAAAVFGNVGTLIVFRVGATDAEELVKEFTPTFIEEDLVNLPKYEMYLKLMIDGISSNPFSAKGLPPLSAATKTNNMEAVIQASRNKYANEREIVEEKIRRWHESFEEESRPSIRGDETSISRPRFDSQPRPEETGYATKCSHCGIDVRTPFKPDGVRPVYCKDCLKKAQEIKQKELDERKKKKVLELKKFEEETAPEARPALTLDDLAKARPVDFKGKEQPLPKSDVLENDEAIKFD
jgi:CxxC-x17-CxxC domain-containing protein